MRASLTLSVASVAAVLLACSGASSVLLAGGDAGGGDATTGGSSGSSSGSAGGSSSGGSSGSGTGSSGGGTSGSSSGAASGSSGGTGSSGSSGGSSGSSSSGGSSGSSGSSSGASGSSGSSSGASGSSGSSSGAGDAAGAPCTSDVQCTPGFLCGFMEADGCSAKGSCVAETGGLCNAILLGCACDGTDFNVICAGLPDGYASKPLAHMGVCTIGIDAGTDCDADSQCAAGLKCCYPCGTPGCRDMCLTPEPNGSCPLYP